MSVSTDIDVIVHGRGGHGSRPETTVDPVVTAAYLVTRLQTVVSREIAARDVRREVEREFKGRMR